MKTKSKLKSLLVMLGVVAGCIFNTTTVNAQNASLSMSHSGYWWTRTSPTEEAHSWYTEDYYFGDRVAYCIEPGVTEGTDNYIVGNWNNTGYSNAVKEKVLLMAYYGYDYTGHQTLRYRLATQALIWETVGNYKITYSTERWNAGTIIDVSAERNEIMRLVNNHYNKPSFNGQTVKVKVGDTITLTDTNNVLSGYDVILSNNAEYSINGNNLTVRATNVGDITIQFKKKLYTTREYIVYYGDGIQNMVSSGAVDPVYAQVNIKSEGGKVEFNKYDKDTNSGVPQGEATLEGAVYGVYDKKTDALISKVTTNSDGYGMLEHLPYFGDFYLQEITPSKGYQLDTTKYNFTSSLSNIDNKVIVNEKVINRDVEVTKVYATDESKIMTPEPNVKFGFYNNKGELYTSKTTDKNGKLNVNLVYGTYTVKQLTTSKDTTKVKDFKVEVYEMGDKLYYTISNAEITAKLKVIKIDSDTKEVIARSGIKFKIVDAKTKEYVCQTITYPKAETICEYETDSNGILITPYPLNSGTYYLEEVDQVIDGYTWNKTSVEFTIGEDAELITDNEFGILFETNFENKEVKGEVNIHKTGEDVNYLESGYEYVNINLEDVKIGLYASEDIYSANGTLKYKKGSLIGTYKSDSEGNIKISNLYLGKYYLEEIETKGNHVLDNTKYEFELKYKDQYTEVITYNTKIDNYMKKGTLEFTKSDLTTGKGISNTKVSIYTEDDKLIFEGTTNKEGKITIKDLFVGKFYIIETEASTGYRLSDEKVYFEIKENEEVVKANMTNEKVKGTLEFTKTDFSTSEPLPNTLIEIYDENDKLIFSGRTNSEGKIVIEELEYGKYYILEKEAPEGYELNTERMYFEITEDGEIVKCTMTDNQIVEVPNTMKNEMPVVPIAITSLLVFGVGLILYGKSKNKKK